ncbi:hypothetical protein Droror1_Dr00022177 [Drosera rotundifolia]
MLQTLSMLREFGLLIVFLDVERNMELFKSNRAEMKARWSKPCKLIFSLVEFYDCR